MSDLTTAEAAGAARSNVTPLTIGSVSLLGNVGGTDQGRRLISLLPDPAIVVGAVLQRNQQATPQAWFITTIKDLGFEVAITAQPINEYFDVFGPDGSSFAHSAPAGYYNGGILMRAADIPPGGGTILGCPYDSGGFKLNTIVHKGVFVIINGNLPDLDPRFIQPL